jgi:hypothetical protein
MSLLPKPDGSAFYGESLSVWFTHANEHAGLPDACVILGLRETAGHMLADAGSGARQIMSITGHKSHPPW